MLTLGKRCKSMLKRPVVTKVEHKIAQKCHFSSDYFKKTDHVMTVKHHNSIHHNSKAMFIKSGK